MKILKICTSASLLLAILCLIQFTTAKRFDINNNFGSIEDFDIDIPELIEVNKVDLPESSSKFKPGKPKPEFTLPSLPSFSSLPQSLGLSSTWTLGSSLGGSHVPEFSALAPPVPTSLYYSQTAAAPANSLDTTLFLTPGQYEISHSQYHGPPPRPPPIISSNSLTDYTQIPSSWASQPQSPPFVLSQQSKPQTSPVVLSQQPQPLPVFLEEEFSPSQSPPSWPAQQAHPWTAQTPSASAQAPSPSWSQPPSAGSQIPQWSSQPAPAPEVLQLQTPHWHSQTPPQQQYSSSQPSKPFSLYQQLNLHLLEPSTWDRLQDSKHQWEQKPPANRPQQPPLQLQQVQGNAYQVAPPASPPALMPPLAEVLLLVNSTNTGSGPANNGDSTSSGSNNEILDPLDGTIDYVHHGQPQLPHLTNSEITVDDDKYFDNDDEYTVDEVETDDDEIMQMIE